MQSCGDECASRHNGVATARANQRSDADIDDDIDVDDGDDAAKGHCVDADQSATGADRATRRRRARRRHALALASLRGGGRRSFGAHHNVAAADIVDVDDERVGVGAGAVGRAALVVDVVAVVVGRHDRPSSVAADEASHYGAQRRR